MLTAPTETPEPAEASETQDMAHAAQVQRQLVLGESELFVLEVGVLEIDLGSKTAGPLNTHKAPQEINVGSGLAKLGAGD